MNTEEIEGTLAFLRTAGRLKDTLRSGFTAEGRPESVAEHSWRLCLMAMTLGPYFPEVDIARVLEICIVHDLGEALRGDVPAPEQVEGDDRATHERADLLTLTAPLPPAVRERIVARWDEYEAALSPEARLAKALDKLETILQHNQGQNPPDFDYRFNLDYGRRYTSDDPRIVAIRRLLDDETEARAQEA